MKFSGWTLSSLALCLVAGVKSGMPGVPLKVTTPA
jgi:hypothetical protein